MSHHLMNLVEQTGMKKELPYFEIGDTVDVHCRILEGDKERIQVFSGTVIARSGAGAREMFTVRRVVQGEGVERKFPLHSPRVARVEVKRAGVVRRAKLYYLRDRVGKAVRLKERRIDRAKREELAAKQQQQRQRTADELKQWQKAKAKAEKRRKAELQKKDEVAAKAAPPAAPTKQDSAES